MSEAKSLHVSGRDHYDAIYRGELELEAQWLAYGSVDKVDSIEQLLREQDIHPRSVLELGCGTGAVIRECQRRGIGTEFTAVDYSQEAIAYLERHSAGIRARTADLLDRACRFDEPYDLVVLSHVLEHLEQPEQFLRGMLAKIRFAHTVIEVPLEDLPASRLKNLFRDRRKNAAGHVQFFTQRSISTLLAGCGLEPIAVRRYAPVLSDQMIRLLQRKNGDPRAKTAVRRLTGHYGPKLLASAWAQLYYSNIAFLCRPAAR